MKSEIELIVRGYHLDVYAHVNNARYVEFLEEGRWASIDDSKAVRDLMKKGYAFTVVNINISYLAPAVLGDVLLLQTGVKEVGNKKIVLFQKMYKKSSMEAVVDAEVTFVMVDTGTGRAVVVDDDIRKNVFIE